MDNKQIEKELEVLAETRAKITKDMASSDEVAQIFAVVLDVIVAIKESFGQEMAKNKGEDVRQKKELQQYLLTEITDAESRMQDLYKQIEKKEAVDIEQVRTQLLQEINTLRQAIPTIPSLDPIFSRINDIELKIAQIPQKDTTEQIRDGLESLKGDERLDKSAVKGIEELEKKIDEKNKSGGFFGGGQRPPVTIQGFGLTVDKNVRFINFKGTGLTSVVRTADGVVTVTIAGGGAGSTNILTEKLTPTTSGSDITLNLLSLSQTFSTIQWVSKNGQLLDPNDGSFGWSRVGNTITVLNAGDSDVFLVSYTY